MAQRVSTSLMYIFMANFQLKQTLREKFKKATILALLKSKGKRAKRTNSF